MEKVIVMLAVMAAAVLLAFVMFSVIGCWLFRWSRKQPHRQPVLGLVIAVLLAVASIGMILFKWNFSYSKTVNGVGTNIHVQLGWLFLLPLALAVAALVFWIKAFCQRPTSQKLEVRS